MSDLKETDEEVGKAGRWTLRHSISASKRYADTKRMSDSADERAAGGKKVSGVGRAYQRAHARSSRVISYLEDRRRRVRKAHEALDAAIEKAGKGLIRGGSLRNWRGMVRRDGANAKNMAQGKTPLARGLQNGARLKRARSFLAARVGRVKKSTDPISTLYAEIEKARGNGLIRGGSKRMSRVANRHADHKYKGFGSRARADKLKRYAGLRAEGLRDVPAPGWRGTVTFRRK